MSRSIRRFGGARAGVLLDAVVALGLVLVGAYALAHVGLTFGELVQGARSFFGL